jgi:hypothetical protein
MSQAETGREGQLPVREHVVKVDHNAWEDIRVGRKTFEIRLNDRFYQRGDTLKLLRMEGTFLRSMNSILTAKIGYIHSGLGMNQDGCGYVVLALGDVEGPFHNE